MRKILVLRGGALGDFIVTLPLLARARAAFPEAEIEIIGNREAAEIGINARLLSQAHSQHDARWLPLFLDQPLPEDLRNWLGEFDLVLNFWPDDDGQIAEKFPVRSGQIFLSRGAAPILAPAADHFAKILDPLEVASGANFFSLARQNPGARCIAIHAGSGSANKNWPIERWLGLAAWLCANGQRLIFIAGPAEPVGVFEKFGHMVHCRPLDDVVRALREARLFIGHDSGISHLAAACGVPSLLLFGPTDPRMWAPPAPHVRILRHTSELAQISLSDVQAAISGLARL